jgi:hypothetical protein
VVVHSFPLGFFNFFFTFVAFLLLGMGTQISRAYRKQPLEKIDCDSIDTFPVTLHTNTKMKKGKLVFLAECLRLFPEHDEQSVILEIPWDQLRDVYVGTQIFPKPSLLTPRRNCVSLQFENHELHLELDENQDVHVFETLLKSYLRSRGKVLTEDSDTSREVEKSI